MWRPDQTGAGQAWREDRRIFLEGQWAGLAGPELLSPENRWKQPQTTEPRLFLGSESGGHWLARKEDSFLKPGSLCSTWRHPGRSGRGWCVPAGRAGHGPPPRTALRGQLPLSVGHGTLPTSVDPARFQGPCPFFHAGCSRAGPGFMGLSPPPPTAENDALDIVGGQHDPPDFQSKEQNHFTGAREVWGSCLSKVKSLLSGVKLRDSKSLSPCAPKNML